MAISETRTTTRLGGNPRLSLLWVVKLQFSDLFGQWTKQTSVTETLSDLRHEAGPTATSSPTSRSLSSPESWTSVANNTRAHTSVVLSDRDSPNCGNPSARAVPKLLLIFPHQQPNCQAISHTLQPTGPPYFYLLEEISCNWHQRALTDFDAPQPSAVIQCTVAGVLTCCDINVTSTNSQSIKFTVWMGLLNKPQQ